MNTSDARDSPEKKKPGPFNINIEKLGQEQSGQPKQRNSFLPPFMERAPSGGATGSGQNNVTMNHSYRSRTSTIHNPSQVSVIQS